MMYMYKWELYAIRNYFIDCASIRKLFAGSDVCDDQNHALFLYQKPSKMTPISTYMYVCRTCFRGISFLFYHSLHEGITHT